MIRHLRPPGEQAGGTIPPANSLYPGKVKKTLTPQTHVCGLRQNLPEKAQKPVQHLRRRFLVHIMAAGQSLPAHILGAQLP